MTPLHTMSFILELKNYSIFVFQFLKSNMAKDFPTTDEAPPNRVVLPPSADSHLPHSGNPLLPHSVDPLLPLFKQNKFDSMEPKDCALVGSCIEYIDRFEGQFKQHNFKVAAQLAASSPGMALTFLSVYLSG